MFLDETGITTNLLRRYGRAPRGARVHDHAPCGRWQTSTFLAALRVTGLTAPGVFDGAIDGESFRAYIEQILVPTLQPGDIVIADNLGAHKVAGIQRAIQAAGATLWYLPPYSPDLNPIELCFAKLKALVRTARCRRDVPPILSSTSVESPIIRKGRSDVKKRFTEAQIIGFLRETEAGLPVKDLCRRHGFSEASYYLWRSKFGGMSVSDAKRLKELETENGRLKKLLAESQLEIEVTREVLRKKW